MQRSVGVINWVSNTGVACAPYDTVIKNDLLIF